MSPILSYKAQRCEMTLDRLQQKTTAAASECKAWASLPLPPRRPPFPVLPARPPPTHPHGSALLFVCSLTALRLNAAVWYHFTAVGVLERVSVCLG